MYSEAMEGKWEVSGLPAGLKTASQLQSLSLELAEALRRALRPALL